MERFRQILRRTLIDPVGRLLDSEIEFCQAATRRGHRRYLDCLVAGDDALYEGVTVPRVVLARPYYFLDLFLAECDGPGASTGSIARRARAAHGLTQRPPGR